MTSKIQMATAVTMTMTMTIGFLPRIFQKSQ